MSLAWPPLARTVLSDAPSRQVWTLRDLCLALDLDLNNEQLWQSLLGTDAEHVRARLSKAPEALRSATARTEARAEDEA